MSYIYTTASLLVIIVSRRNSGTQGTKARNSGHRTEKGNTPEHVKEAKYIDFTLPLGLGTI